MADPNDLTQRDNMKSLMVTFGADEQFATFLTGNRGHQLNLDTIEKLSIANDSNMKNTMRRMEKPPPIRTVAQDGTVTTTEQNLGQPTPYFMQYLEGLFYLARYYREIGFSAAEMTKPMFGLVIVTLFLEDREMLKSLVERELDKMPKCQAGAHNNRQYLIVFLQKVDVWAMCNFTKLTNMAPFSIYCRDNEPTTRPDIDFANNNPCNECTCRGTTRIIRG